MSNIDKVSGIALGIYLLGIIINNNSQQLINFIEQQKEFAKWALALAVLYIIAKEFKNSVAYGFIYIAIVAMLITAAGNNSLDILSQQIKKLIGY
jgi:NADH:ubiquinone oxidoreductase subunit H